MLASFATGPPRTAVLRPVLLAALTKPRIQLLLVMLNWWEHRGCKRDQTCTWQPAPIRSWSSARIVSCGRTGPVVLKSSNSRRKNRRKKEKAKPKRPRLSLRRLSPCPQQPCRHHDWPNCARFHSETTFSGRAEDGDCSFHRPTGEDYGGRAVVDGVNMHVRAGEIVGLLGPNGAGKTTSFYMIVGLVRPNSGRVIFCDTDVTDYPMYKRARLGMGYLPQEESIFRKMTVEQNIMAILQMLPLSKAERRNRCDQLLHQFGIERIAKNTALTLSGGEKRRLTIARSLVTQPKLLMLDEPFIGVDPIAVYDVQQIIVNLRKSGLAIMITDHNVRETLSIVDRAYLIYDGRVESEGTKDFLINDPISRQLYLGERFKM